MAWQQLTFISDKTNAEAIEAWLDIFGALAITLENASNDAPIYEPKVGTTPLWDQIRVIALFDATDDREQILAALFATFDKEKILTPTWENLADQAWERTCLDDFKPMCFGQKLWIYPSHLTPPADANISVKLDPGLAFGTGTHPTTAMCLRWLDAHIQGGEKVLDYGCGSGILAISALKLGAKQATCVDYDAQALEASRENARKNEIEEEYFLTRSPETFSITASYDIVIANILCNPLIKLSFILESCVKPNKFIVLSGILAPQIEEVKSAYCSKFDFNQTVIEGEWGLLFGKKIV